MTVSTREADAAFCAGRAGVPILSAALLREAPRLLVVSDVNAVPPAGVEGLDAMADKAAGTDAAATNRESSAP